MLYLLFSGLWLDIFLMNNLDFFLIRLKPLSHQTKHLEGLFEGPSLVGELLRKESLPIRSRGEASFFLLKNKDKLEPYLFSQNRNKAIDLLTSLVMSWSNAPPIDYEIAFEENCSISRHKQIHLPLRGLGGMDVESVSDLEKAWHGRRYKESFSLLYKEQSFYIQIPFIGSATQKQENNNVRKKQVFLYKEFIKLFSQRVRKHYMNELRQSKQFGASRFNRIEGRPVAGGLPYQGKKR